MPSADNRHMIKVNATILSINGRSGGLGLKPCQKRTVYISQFVINPSQKNVTTKALNKTVPNDTGSLRELRALQSKAVTGIVNAIGMTKKMIFSITCECGLTIDLVEFLRPIQGRSLQSGLALHLFFVQLINALSDRGKSFIKRVSSAVSSVI